MSAKVLRFSDYDRPAVPRWPRDPDQFGAIVLILPIVYIERHDGDLKKLKPKR